MQLQLTFAQKTQPLGEAYELGSNIVSSVSSALSGATDQSRSIEFPGISFPFNGEVYQLIPPQEVFIDNGFIDVLQTFFGAFVGILCFLSLIHIFEDAFICIFSGVSFWGFIRGRHDR